MKKYDHQLQLKLDASRLACAKELEARGVRDAYIFVVSGDGTHVSVAAPDTTNVLGVRRIGVIDQATLAQRLSELSIQIANGSLLSGKGKLDA